MHVIATAGHVDHGKSTLVRALTSMEPDRWAEERRRGMTIDLGYAWFTLPSGDTIAFVDVPGHQRFIGNMLAGLGPAPAVMMVMAADEGWREQSTEHLAAADALGLRHGLVVATRSDLADPAAALAESRRRLAASTLAGVHAVAVSAVSGAGLEELRTALSRLVATLPEPTTAGRVRLWIDRSFTIRGAGTVVTGTLGAGNLATGEEVELNGQRVRIRGLQSLGADHSAVAAVARVAVNLRGVPREAAGRGDALLTPGAWRPTTVIDVRFTHDCSDLPSELVLHVGTAAVPVRVRPLDQRTARLTLARELPLQTGDRAILSDRSRHHLPRGVLVVDPDPLPLRRRGAAAARAADLARIPDVPTLVDQLRWRGAVRASDLIAWGVRIDPPPGTPRIGDWLVSPEQWARWIDAVRSAVKARADTSPRDPFLTVEAAVAAAGLPDHGLITALATAAGLQVNRSGVGEIGLTASMGDAETAVVEIERLLRARPFVAPDRNELNRLRLGTRELATAAAIGRLLRLQQDLVLLPDAPALAMRVLAALPQPFTTSQARQALDSTRRVVIPLLEHLDGRGWTERLDGDHRQVARSTPTYSTAARPASSRATGTRNGEQDT